MSNIIVQRDFEIIVNDKSQLGSIKILQPVEADSDWVCDCVVSVGDFEKTHGIFGVDSWQALQLAIDFAPIALEMTPDIKTAVFKMWGEEIEDYFAFFDSSDVDDEDENDGEDL